jgi:hypothetical protein
VYKIIDKLQLHPQWRLPPGVVVGCILEGLLAEYNKAKRHLENTLNQYNISTIMNYLSTKELSLGRSNGGKSNNEAMALFSHGNGNSQRQGQQGSKKHNGPAPKAT